MPPAKVRAAWEGKGGARMRNNEAGAVVAPKPSPQQELKGVARIGGEGGGVSGVEGAAEAEGKEE